MGVSRGDFNPPHRVAGLFRVRVSLSVCSFFCLWALGVQDEGTPSAGTSRNSASLRA